MKKESELNVNDILIAEFNYAAQTASQANEDRVKVFSFIIANLGTFVAAIILPSLNSSINISVFGLIFILLTFIGTLSIFQLSRLRAAWIDSVRSMNRIKDYYIKDLKILKLEDAFRWKTATIPSQNKINSLAFLLTITIIFLNSCSVSASTYIFSKNIIISILIGLILGISEVYIWLKILK